MPRLTYETGHLNWALPGRVPSRSLWMSRLYSDSGVLAVLQNGVDLPLTAGQIAAHLQVQTWNVTRELKLGEEKENTSRLRGRKVRGAGVGQGGQWRVDRQVYLDWLQIPEEDRTALGPDGLPELTTAEDAAAQLRLAPAVLRAVLRQQRWPHIVFGRKRYLTHNQMERIRVQLDKDLREATPGGRDPGHPVT
jgi:hypothetical protein